MVGRAAGVLVVMLLALALAPGVANAAPKSGQTSTGSITYDGREYPYILHTPGSYKPGKPVPLLVMVHGCQTSADQEMRVTGFNQLADEQGFAVLYPDVDE